MAVIEIIEGRNTGLRHTIEGATTLGRAPTNSICLHDSRASRQHAVIRSNPAGDGYIICDMGSGNGTIVGEVKIKSGMTLKLNSGDQVIIGSTRLRFEDEYQPTPSDMIATDPVVDKSKQSTASRNFDPRGDFSATLSMELDDNDTPNISQTLDASQNMLETQEAEESSDLVRRLRVMVEFAEELGQVTEKSLLLERIIDKLFDIFPQADRAFLLLRDGPETPMRPVIARNRSKNADHEKAFTISRAIISSVAKDGQSILSSNAQEDFGEQKTIADLALRSIMCAPMIVKGEIIGALNVDTITSNHVFNREDLKLITGIASQSAGALANTSLIDKMESDSEARGQFARYVSPDMAKNVIDGRVMAQTDGCRAQGALLCCNIDGFTQMSEELPPEKVVDNVRHCFKVAADIVARNGGALNRFGGDIITAMWNVMLPDDMPEVHAVTAALQLQNSAWHFNLDCLEENQPKVYFRIGLNSGEFTSGNIGGEHIEYMVIGNQVNLTHHVEQVAGHWQIIASEKVYREVGELCCAITCEPLKSKYESDPVKIYSIRGIKTPDGQMKLNIPVRIFDQNDEQIGNGLVTGRKGMAQQASLFLASGSALPAGAEITLYFDLPEFSSPMRVGGTVLDESRHTYYGEAAFSKVTMGKLKCSEKVFDFMNAGSLLDHTGSL